MRNFLIYQSVEIAGMRLARKLGWNFADLTCLEGEQLPLISIKTSVGHEQVNEVSKFWYCLITLHIYLTVPRIFFVCKG